MIFPKNLDVICPNLLESYLNLTKNATSLKIDILFVPKSRILVNLVQFGQENDVEEKMTKLKTSSCYSKTCLLTKFHPKRFDLFKSLEF